VRTNLAIIGVDCAYFTGANWRTQRSKPIGQKIGLVDWTKTDLKEDNLPGIGDCAFAFLIM
jgi:hypothetical protein